MKRILLFFICVLFFLFSFVNRYQPVSLDLIQPTTKSVEIKGEVKNPGVYTVKYDATVQDVINQAGGCKKDADISNISMVREIRDEEVIVVGKEKSVEKISINSASLEELQKLPGIGPSLAQKIIDYRSNQSFSSLEDIMLIKGIKDGLFNKIKDYICL